MIWVTTRARFEDKGEGEGKIKVEGKCEGEVKDDENEGEVQWLKMITRTQVPKEKWQATQFFKFL